MRRKRRTLRAYTGGTAAALLGDVSRELTERQLLVRLLLVRGGRFVHGTRFARGALPAAALQERRHHVAALPTEVFRRGGARPLGLVLAEVAEVCRGKTTHHDEGSVAEGGRRW